MMEISERLKGGWDHPESVEVELMDPVEMLDPRDMSEEDQMLGGQRQDGGGHLDLDDHGPQGGGQNVENGLELVAMLGRITGVLGEIIWNLKELKM